MLTKLLNKYFLLIITLFFQFNTVALASSLDPELEKLINSVIGKHKSSLTTEHCDIQKEKWALIMLTKQSFIENIKFKKGCDIEGKFTVKADTYFPIKLKLRNLKNYKSLKAQMKFEITFTDQAVLNVNLKNSTLSSKNAGKKDIYFLLDYAAAIDPMNTESMIKKRLGGNLILTTKGHKKTIKSYKLK